MEFIHYWLDWIKQSSINLTMSHQEQFEEHRFNKTFSDCLRAHFRELKWSASDLARRTQISQSQLSDWMSGSPRGLRRKYINEIAVALAAKYSTGEDEGQKKPRYELLDGILNELLESSGLSAIKGKENRLWERLIGEPAETRTIRVAWFSWGEFAREGYSRSFDGVSRQIVEIVLRLMGFRRENIKYIKIELDEIDDPHLFTKADIVAPMMKLPNRLLNIAPSANLDRFRIRLNGVTSRKICDKLSFERSKLHIYPEPVLDEVRFLTVRGATSEIFEPIIRYYQGNGSDPIQVESLKQGIEEIDKLTQQEDLDTHPIFLADEITCKKAISSNEELVMVWDKSVLAFSLVMGVSQNENRLRDSLNHAISTFNEFTPEGVLDVDETLIGISTEQKD